MIKTCPKSNVWNASIQPDREDEDGSVHMSEGGERESYEDLRLMLSELLDEKERCVGMNF